MDRTDGTDGVFGLSTERAAEAVVAAEARDPEAVRSVLDHVAADDRVTRESVEAATSDAAKRLATAETRVELARSDLADATATAADVADLDLVRARLDRYEAALDDVAAEVRALGTDLQRVSTPDDDPEAVYEAARALREVAAGADGAQRRADEVGLDLEAFEAWLGSPDRRRRGFEEDVDVVADTLADARAGADASDAETWADATLRAALVPALVADLRADLADLRALAERDGAADEGWARDLADRLADLDSRARRVRASLDDAAEQAWRESHGERIAAFERAVDAVEPPVGWAEVQAELERARALDEPYPRR